MYELRRTKRKGNPLRLINYTRNFRIGHFAQDFLEFLSFSGGQLPVNPFLVTLLRQL